VTDTASREAVGEADNQTNHSGSQVVTLNLSRGLLKLAVGR